MGDQPTTVLFGGPMPTVLEALASACEKDEGLQAVGWRSSPDTTVEAVVASRPHVVVVCADAEQWDGVRTCAEIKRLDPATRVIVVGRDSDDSTLLSVVRSGADGFVTVEESMDDLLDALKAVDRGESRIPPWMLGSLLRGLIEFRRADDAAVDRFSRLGRREREVLVEIVAGLDHHAIAAKLHLSPHTARAHTQNILAKLGVHSRIEATRLVFEHDLLARFDVEVNEDASRNQGVRK